MLTTVRVGYLSTGTRMITRAPSSDAVRISSAPPQQSRALLHAQQAETTCPSNLLKIEPRARIFDTQLDDRLLGRESNEYRHIHSMLHGVSQCLLCNPIERCSNIGRDRERNVTGDQRNLNALPALLIH